MTLKSMTGTIGDHELVGSFSRSISSTNPTVSLGYADKGPAICRYAGVTDLFSVLTSSRFALTAMTSTDISSSILPTTRNFSSVTSML